MVNDGTQNVLLTGATGAIGPMLIEHLRSSGAHDQLIWIVRSPHAMQSEVIGPLRGDLALDRLGLRRQDDDAICRQTNLIIHGAADTRFRAPRHEQHNINVNGTQRMLDLASRCRQLRKFIFISTVCVSGDQTGAILETSTSNPPAFVNYYEQTKWEAERLVLESGLPVEVIRLSIVVGSHDTGAIRRLGAIHHILRWFGRGLIPVVMGTDSSRIDIIATETAARFIAKAAAAAPRPGAIYHVAAGDDAATLFDLRAFSAEHLRGPGLKKSGSITQFVDEATFRRFCESLDPVRDRLIAQAMDSIDTFIPTLLYERVYDTTRARQLWGGPLPLYDWRTTLLRVMRNCLSPPRERARSAAMA